IGGWSEDKHRPNSIEYVRADIFQTLKNQRNEWQSVAQHAGVCMTCAIRAPETYGCTDCLNTGWDGGSPAGFVRSDKLEELKAENERLRGDCRAYEKTMQAIA